MSTWIDELLKLLHNQKKPVNRQETLKKIFHLWTHTNFDVRIVKIYLDVLQDSNEDIETRLLVAKNLVEIKNNNQNKDSQIYINFLDDFIKILNTILELEFDKGINFINYIVSRICDFGTLATYCFNNLHQLYAKEIDYQIKETLNKTLYKIDEKRSIEIFLEQLLIKHNAKVLCSMLDILNNHLKTNKIWLEVKDVIIKLVYHEEESVRHRAIDSIRYNGHVTDGEIELLTQMEKEYNYTNKLLIVIALGTVGITNKNTVELLSHYLHSGDPNFTKYAKESLEKIAERSTEFEDYKEMINVIVKGEKRRSKINDYREEKFGNPELFADPLIKQLINDLNLEYSMKHNTCVFMIARKLIENLIIDIIRKRYPNQEHLLTYVDRKKRKMIHNLSILIDNLFADTNIFVNVNLRQYKSTIEQIKERLEEICDITNPVVHSISFRPNDQDSEDLKLLFDRIFPILARLLTK